MKTVTILSVFFILTIIGECKEWCSFRLIKAISANFNPGGMGRSRTSTSKPSSTTTTTTLMAAPTTTTTPTPPPTTITTTLPSTQAQTTTTTITPTSSPPPTTTTTAPANTRPTKAATTTEDEGTTTKEVDATATQLQAVLEYLFNEGFVNFGEYLDVGLQQLNVTLTPGTVEGDEINSAIDTFVTKILAVLGVTDDGSTKLKRLLTLVFNIIASQVGKRF